MKKRNIFEGRENIFPHDYPELIKFKDAIRQSYWTDDEYNFTHDVKDYKINLTEQERLVIKRAMLAIAQVEVTVKTFWGKIYERMPIDEIGDVGATFSESEVRHKDAYAKLLRVLGLEEEFKHLVYDRVIYKRLKYLNKYTEYLSITKNSKLERLERTIKLFKRIGLGTGKLDKKLEILKEKDKVESRKRFTKALILFSLFIEHVSLFSQFFIIMSFDKHKSMLKGISNAVEATSKEEQIHGDFGIELVKIIRNENPDWFNEELEKEIQTFAIQACEAESLIVDWIFQDGDLSFLTKDQVQLFVIDRFNRSLKSLGLKEIFKIDKENTESFQWFYDELLISKEGDFFVKVLPDYSKHNKSISADDLF